jgi:hypothetical protein
MTKPITSIATSYLNAIQIAESIGLKMCDLGKHQFAMMQTAFKEVFGKDMYEYARDFRPQVAPETGYIQFYTYYEFKDVILEFPLLIESKDDKENKSIYGAMLENFKAQKIASDLAIKREIEARKKRLQQQLAELDALPISKDF